MNEEKQKILQMLDEGKITVDEAMKLLESVNNDSTEQNQYSNINQESDHPREQYQKQQHEWRDQWREQQNDWEGDWERPESDWDFSWINDLRSAVNSMVSDNFAGARDKIAFTNSAEIGNGIKLLELVGKNMPVRVESYEGDRLIIEVRYQMKRNGQRPQFLEKNGEFSLNYNIDDYYSIGIMARVPSFAEIDTLLMENRNSSIVIDEIVAHIIKAVTKNSSIKISDTEADSIYCQTKNAQISLEDIEAREIEAYTANSQILVDDVNAEAMKLATSNARIKVDDSDIVRLYARTTNSSVVIDDMTCERQIEYYVDAAATNGNITLDLPDEDIKCRLHASTTNSRVVAALNGMQYLVNEKNNVEAQSVDYDSMQGPKVNLKLQTTNAKITIEG